MLGNFVAETANAPGTSQVINLAGPLTDRVGFLTAFSSGSKCFYFMDDSTQAEAGIATVTAGSPNTLSRDTVLWNSSVGHTNPSRLNFTGSVKVYCDVPAEKAAYFDDTGKLTVPGALAAGDNITTAKGFIAALTGGLQFTGSAATVTSDSSGNLLLRAAAAAKAKIQSSGSGNPLLQLLAAAATDPSAAVVLSQITGDTGHQLFPSGIMLQWGQATLSTGSLAIAYPVAFASVVYAVVATPKSAGVSEVHMSVDPSVSLSYFNAYSTAGGTLTATAMSWIAAGK